MVSFIHKGREGLLKPYKNRGFVAAEGCIIR